MVVRLIYLQIYPSLNLNKLRYCSSRKPAGTCKFYGSIAKTSLFKNAGMQLNM